MTLANYQTMNLDQLRRYVLTHREDNEAFYAYVDRSKSEGRMVSIKPNDEHWEEKVIEAIRYSENSIRWYCDDTKNRQNQSQKMKGHARTQSYEYLALAKLNHQQNASALFEEFVRYLL
jgi:hypothetical protein